MLNIVPALAHLFLAILFCFMLNINPITPRITPVIEENTMLKMPKITPPTPKLLSFICDSSFFIFVKALFIL